MTNPTEIVFKTENGQTIIESGSGNSTLDAALLDLVSQGISFQNITAGIAMLLGGFN